MSAELGHWQGNETTGAYRRQVLTDRRFYAYGLLEPPARAYRVLTDRSDHWVGEITGAKPGDDLLPSATVYRKVATALDCVSVMRFVDIELFELGWLLALAPRERVAFQMDAWLVARTGGSLGWLKALDKTLELEHGFDSVRDTYVEIRKVQLDYETLIGSERKKREILRARGLLRAGCSDG
jgi:hypothetical protein